MASWSFPATPGSRCARGTRPAGGGLSCSRRFLHERLSSPAALWTAADQASISSTPAGSWVRQNVHSGVLCGARADRPYLRGILSAAAAHNHRAERRLGARLFDAHYIVGGPAVVANGTAATDAPLHDHAYPLARRMRASAAKSARLIQRLTESLWCSISPAMASGSHECQFPGRASMTHRNSLPFALFSWGVAFALKRRRRHAALASHGITSAARRARANAEARGGGPGGSEGGPAPDRWQSAHLFGKIHSSGAARSAAAQLRAHTPAGAGDRR